MGERMRRMMFICLALVATMLAAPAAAYAVDGSYTTDELSTELTVETNSAVHVVERQTLTFSDRNAGVTWFLHVPQNSESVRISNVRVAPVDDGGTLLGDWTRLQMVDSKPDQQGKNPGDIAEPERRTIRTQPWYSYNIGDGMMRCYFPTGKAAIAANAAKDPDAQGEMPDFHTYVIETDYTISHYVSVYRDIAELRWRYANYSIPNGARNVTLQVVLPLPADMDPAVASESIRAWGHSSDAGTFTIGENGTVTYRVERVGEGHYADAHVIFPAGWLTNIPPNAANLFSELREPDAIAEESEWVDISLREAAWDNKVRVVFLAIALLVIAIGAVSVIRHGRSARSHRALIRMAATLAIVALGEHLFFHELITTVILLLLAIVMGLVSFAIPPTDEDDADGVDEDAEDAEETDTEEDADNAVEESDAEEAAP